MENLSTAWTILYVYAIVLIAVICTLSIFRYVLVKIRPHFRSEMQQEIDRLIFTLDVPLIMLGLRRQ